MRLRIYVCAVLIAALSGLACNSADRSSNNSAPPVAASPATPNSVPAGPSQADAPASIPQPETIHADGVRRITTAELQGLLANGAVVVVDVRNEQSYKAGHIPGAKLIPVENVIAQSKTLPRNKLIVTYCS